MNAVMLPNRTVFIADTYVNLDPTAEEIAEITLLAADEIRRFGITPKVALLSHSSFGSSDHPQAKKMRDGARARQREGSRARSRRRDARRRRAGRGSADARVSRLAAQGRGEPADHADASTPRTSRSTCSRSAAGGGVTLGPILLGVAKPVHILTPSATVRRIVNMTALTVVDAIVHRPA